jgi:lipoprotein-anchoring transpeptidase ErfK/SrfK
MHRITRSLLLFATIPLAALTSPVARANVPATDLALTANLDAKTLIVMRGSDTVKVYDVAVGADNHPTPTGTFAIRKIVWNPAWVPPDEKWAKGKQPKHPGHPENPMKLVKLFFQEPDYYIHGTDAVESLGQAASHGCLRMDPNDAGELGLMVMENAGVSRDWDWVKGLLHLGQERTVSLQRPAPLTIVR